VRGFILRTKVKAASRAALKHYRSKNLLGTVLCGVMLGRLFSMVRSM
jgi:hypothetical protein